MDDSAPGNLTLSADDESLFSVNHNVATHDARLKSSQTFFSIRRACETFGYDSVDCSLGTLKKRYRVNFEEGVRHIVSRSRNGQVLLPLVHGECTKCVDTLIVACSILSEALYVRIMETGLTRSLAALLKATVRPTVNSKLRLALVQAAKKICQKDQGSNSELLSNTSHFRKHNLSLTCLGKFLDSKADAFHNDCRDDDAATESRNRKRRRKESFGEACLNIEPLRLDSQMMRALEEREDDWSEALSNETSDQARSSIQQFSASSANLVQGVFEGCVFQQAFEVSSLWRKERADGSSRTNCITAHIPSIEGQDITFVIRVAQDPGFAIIEYLQFRDSVEVVMGRA
ncbi:hypothetical protein CSPX01_00645 [Colletotrichum filicis]|nr:hypothetical protein CSPX01_00645 [Colletotrichum filicis]